jgi:hypothetical protein
MYSDLIIHVGSQLLSSIMGGMAVFCIYYAATLSDFHIVSVLLGDALIWGGLASAIVYCQNKYLGS